MTSGLTVEIIDGPAAGRAGTIVSNTASSVEVLWDPANSVIADPAVGSSYRIFGLEGFGDLVNVDDSDEVDANVGTLTQTTLTGLDMPTSSEVQSILVRADAGSFVLGSDDWNEQVAVIDIDAPLSEVKIILQALYESLADVDDASGLRVSRAGNTYTLTLGGALEEVVEKAEKMAAEG